MTSANLRTIAATVASVCLALTSAQATHIVTLPHWLAGLVAILGIVAAVFVPSPAGATKEQVIKAALDPDKFPAGEVRRASASVGVVPVLVIFGLLSTALGFGCPATTGTPAPGSPVANFDHCSSDVVRDKAVPLLGLVARATLGGDYMGALAALAMQYGLPEMKCAVQLFVDTTTRKAALDSTAQLQRERAKGWLATESVDGGT
jgi:hypothetical protein